MSRNILRFQGKYKKLPRKCQIVYFRVDSGIVCRQKDDILGDFRLISDM